MQSTRVICGGGTTLPTELIAIGLRIVGSVTIDTLDPPKASDPWMKMETVNEPPTESEKLGGAAGQLVAVADARIQISPVAA
jgi:hypothetical protein